MKYLILSISLLVLLQTTFTDLIGQSTYSRQISTILDEYPVKSGYLNEGNLLFITHRGEIAGSHHDYFFNYSNILYKMDFELNIVDSLVIETTGNYELLVKDIIKSDDNGVLVWANALDITTYDVQLCLIWLDNQMNIVSENIHGLSDMDEVISSHIINQNDKLIFTGSTDFEDYSGDYILWEFDLEGLEINKEIHSGPVPSLPSIIEIPGSEKYHIHAWFDILQFDYDFSFETLYNFSDTVGVLPTGHCKNVDDYQYLQTGTYMQPPVPGSPWEMEMAFVLLDENASLLNVNLYGEEYVLDNGGKLDFLTPDTIYFAGTKNLTNNPPEDSWISLYVTNLEGEGIDSTFYGEAGQNAFKDIFALPNGGYIIAGTVWDFYNYPDTNYQRDIVIFTENYGAPATGIFDEENILSKDIIVYPNPSVDMLKISSEMKNLQLYLYDHTGKEILIESFQSSISINTSTLASGLYFYKIFQSEIEIKSGKWIKSL